jgi:SanA protein
MSDEPVESPRRQWARRWTAASLATGAALPIAYSVQRQGAKRIVAPEQARAEVALVLGATVARGVGPVLTDRVLTAASLFHSGQVRRLLLSGSPGGRTGDELSAMERLALDAGVPAPALTRDPRGRHTFESFASARELGLSSLVVVTQRFHLPRSLFIAQRLGLDAVGVPADRRTYERIARYQARELVSSVLAYWLVR